MLILMKDGYGSVSGAQRRLRTLTWVSILKSAASTISKLIALKDPKSPTLSQNINSCEIGQSSRLQRLPF